MSRLQYQAFYYFCLNSWCMLFFSCYSKNKFLVLAPTIGHGIDCFTLQLCIIILFILQGFTWSVFFFFSDSIHIQCDCSLDYIFLNVITCRNGRLIFIKTDFYFLEGLQISVKQKKWYLY